MQFKFWTFVFFQALDSLKQIADGSMDDIDFPMEENDIKQETDDYDLPDNCLEVWAFVY